MKKSLLIKVLTIAVALCNILCIAVGCINEDRTPDGGTKGLAYTLTVDEAGYVLTGIGFAKDCDIIIPSKYKDLPVVGINEYAFEGNNLITSITIGNNVTSIGEYAFSGCSSLESITIPDSVTSIGARAFNNCLSLESVVIGNGVTSIGSNAFDYCRSLESIIIPDSVTSIGARAFNSCSLLTTIYCRATNKPSGWLDNWSYGCNAEIVWGYKGN